MTSYLECINLLPFKIQSQFQQISIVKFKKSIKRYIGDSDQLPLVTRVILGNWKQLSIKLRRQVLDGNRDLSANLR